MTRTPLVAANWKMNGRYGLVAELGAALAAADLGSAEVAVCPPFPYLPAVAGELAGGGLMLGAQDVSSEPDGAFTGQVSASMLTDVGANVSIIGHSERRRYNAETDDGINNKVRMALDSALWVVLCIGETLEQRKAGNAIEVILQQLRHGLMDVPADQMRQLVVAYEPVWAIGTGMTATPADAQEAHRMIRFELKTLYDGGLADSTRIIYGGSMNASNAAELLGCEGIDGGLIGGASLKSDEFVKICSIAAEQYQSKQPCEGTPAP